MCCRQDREKILSAWLTVLILEQICRFFSQEHHNLKISFRFSFFKANDEIATQPENQEVFSRGKLFGFEFEGL